MERVFEWLGEGGGFDDGVEEEDVWVECLLEDLVGVRGLVE